MPLLYGVVDAGKTAVVVGDVLPPEVAGTAAVPVAAAISGVPPVVLGVPGAVLVAGAGAVPGGVGVGVLVVTCFVLVLAVVPPMVTETWGGPVPSMVVVIVAGAGVLCASVPLVAPVAGEVVAPPKVL
jgi:hypothetical protein